MTTAVDLCEITFLVVAHSCYSPELNPPRYDLPFRSIFGLRRIVISGIDHRGKRLTPLVCRPRRFVQLRSALAQFDFSVREVAAPRYFLGKPGSLFTSTICFVWRSLCAPMKSTHW